MDDNEIEATMRRYRAADPPDGLGERVRTLDSPDRHSDHLWGAVAAAAVVALWLASHAAARTPTPDPLRAAQVGLVADVLGGSDQARGYADLVVPHRDPLAELSVSMGEPW
jgi:hypothetical protein